METTLNTHRLSPRTHVAIWCSAAFSMAALAMVYITYRDVNIWQGWTPADELFRGLYAEPIHHDSILRTRLNTWSNVAFLLTGLYICALGLADRRARRTNNYLAAHPSFSFVFGAACIGLAIGSAFFHASLTRWGQHIDVAMMYAPPLILVTLNGARYAERVTSRFRPVESSIALGVGIWLLLFIYKWSVSSVVVVSLMIAMLVSFAIADLLDNRVATRGRLLLLAAGAMTAGLAFQALDIARVVPDGHALWHGCSAAALWWAYQYQRSETAISGAPSVFVESANSVNSEPNGAIGSY